MILTARDYEYNPLKTFSIFSVPIILESEGLHLNIIFGTQKLFFGTNKIICGTKQLFYSTEPWNEKLIHRTKELIYGTEKIAPILNTLTRIIWIHRILYHRFLLVKIFTIYYEYFSRYKVNRFSYFLLYIFEVK